MRIEVEQLKMRLAEASVSKYGDSVTISSFSDATNAMTELNTQVFSNGSDDFVVEYANTSPKNCSGSEGSFGLSKSKFEEELANAIIRCKKGRSPTSSFDSEILSEDNKSMFEENREARTELEPHLRSEVKSLSTQVGIGPLSQVVVDKPPLYPQSPTSQLQSPLNERSPNFYIDAF